MCCYYLPIIKKSVINRSGYVENIFIIPFKADKNPMKNCIAKVITVK